MPMYTLHCDACDAEFDVFNPIAQGCPKKVKCVGCGSRRTYRQYKPAQVVPDWPPYKLSTLQDFDAPDPRKSSPVVHSRRDLQRVLDSQEKHLGVKLEMM